MLFTFTTSAPEEKAVIFFIFFLERGGGGGGGGRGVPRGTRIVKDRNSVNFITVHGVVLEEIADKEIEVPFYNIDNGWMDGCKYVSLGQTDATEAYHRRVKQ